MRFKQLALNLLTKTPVRRLFWPLMRARIPIFMLHRFAGPTTPLGGHDPAALRANLHYMRRDGYRCLSLLDALRELQERPAAVSRIVVFTVDDGYHDFLHAWPVFVELGVPVTVFLTTGFVDGTLWMWWDKLDVAFAQSARRALSLNLGGKALRVAWSDEPSRRVALNNVIEALKRAPEADRQSALAEIPRQLEAEVPASAPEAYRALSWAEVRQLAQQGCAFGPHSVTHPIMANVDAADAEREIAGSWQRLREEVPGAVPVYCYPSGLRGDFTGREALLLERHGFQAAVAAHGGLADPDDLVRNRFALPRVAYLDELSSFAQTVSGIAHARTRAKGDF